MNLRVLARVFGAVFLLVGVLGFVPGINHMHHDPASEGLIVGGPGHGNLLGLFHVNVLHNAVHILFGIWGLVAGGSWSASRLYFRGVGVIYAVLAILGVIGVAKINKTFGLIPIEGWDVGLHAVLSIAGLILGFGGKPTVETTTTATTTTTPMP
jgi:hypothetical protein